MTIRGRLILMGGSATVGFALLLAIGLYNGWITSRSTAEAQNLREEVRIVNEMRLANLEMILAAMDSIIDRSEGSIRPQRKEVIDASLRMLQSNVEAVDRMASVLGRPELSSTIRPDLAEVSSAMTEVLPSLIARGAGEDEFAKIDDVIDGAGERLNTALTELGRTGYAAASARLDTVSEAAASARTWQVAIAAIFAFAVGAIALMTARSVVRALSRFGADMEAIAGGVLGTAIEAENRTDEIGRLGRSLVSFRNAAAEKSQLERRAEELRSNAERERERTERAKGEEAALTRAAVESLGKGLRRLAEGDLTVRLETPFAGDLEPLRTNFNGAVQQLRETIETIGMAAAQINSGTEEIDATAHDLARRSEQQAASVEETAAAVEQITAAVQSAAERAEETARLVGSARQQAEHSGDVVQAAMSAMDHIAASSEDISRIISVIDDIALQTSLLALNAGVEAARAGDAGKGFAVVAQEVRQLSQRSTNAAKEIKKLILSSGDEVTSGVSQVRATGEALKKITSAVQDVAVNVVAILDTTREQSAGLQDINSSIGSIDTATQQSAALAQGANRSTQNLREQVERINTLLGGFRTTTTPDVVATHTRRVA